MTPDNLKLDRKRRSAFGDQPDRTLVSLDIQGSTARIVTNNLQDAHEYGEASAEDVTEALQNEAEQIEVGLAARAELKRRKKRRSWGARNDRKPKSKR